MIVTTAQMLFEKALLVLDRGELQRGEDILRQALDLAERQPDPVATVRILCCLGELLHELDRSAEALPFLKRVSTIRREDDLLDYETRRAKELLDEISLR